MRWSCDPELGVAVRMCVVAGCSMVDACVYVNACMVCACACACSVCMHGVVVKEEESRGAAARFCEALVCKPVCMVEACLSVEGREEKKAKWLSPSR